MYYVILGVNLCVIFFFFKQKTAYEMRISDWSSDVCSSDLNAVDDCANFRGMQRDRSAVIVEEGCVCGISAGRDAHKIAARRQLRCIEIGRASCRERVCQYV